MKRLIKQHFGKQKDIKKIIVPTLKYMYRIYSANEMTRDIRLYLDSNIRVIGYRKEIQNGYISKNIKLWIWYVITKQLSKKKAINMMVDFKIKEEDEYLIYIAKKYLNKNLIRLSKKYKAHTLKEFDKIIADVLEDIDSYTKKFAFRKLSFIVSDGGQSLEDIVMELKYWGIYTIILQYPQIDDMDHCLNLCKCGIHNHGINIIKHASNMSNNVLIRNKEDNTFSSLKVSIEESFIKENSLDHSVDTNTKTHNRMFVSKILKSYSGKRNKFLSLMSGVYSERFSDYLTKVGYIENNDELYDKLASNNNIDLYISLCASHLGITPYNAKQFLEDLKDKYER